MNKSIKMAITMDKKRLTELVNLQDQIHGLSIKDIARLIHKVKPEWEKLVDEQHGTIGPAYSTKIVLPDTDITLDIITAAYTEFAGSPGAYCPLQWQVVVIEDNTIRANYRDPIVFPAPIKDLFDTVQESYEQMQLLKQLPSLERTKAAIQRYISE